MAKKLFPVALMALVAGLLVISCDEDSTTDPTGTDPDPDPTVNEAPEISTLTAGYLLEDDDTLIIDEEYTRTLVVNDEDPSSLVFELTTDPVCSLKVTGDQLTWTPTADDMGTYNATLTVTDSGGLTDTFSWTFVVSAGIDMSTSLIRFDVNVVTPGGDVIPFLEGLPFVGLVYRQSDSTLIERVVHPAYTEPFELWTTTPIDTGDSVIADCYFDGGADDTYVPPTSESQNLNEWPDPSARWVFDSVRCDITGGYGVPLNSMYLFNANKKDISDLMQ